MKTYTLNGENLDTKLEWLIGDYWYPTQEIKKMTDDELAALGIVVTEIIDTPYEPTLAELKLQKQAEINMAFEQAMSQVKAGYPDDEILTWSKQESEARAYLANNTAETPLLDGYVVVKNVPKNLLAHAIIAKADMFATICGSLVGKRQYLEDVIGNATLTNIQSITW